MDNLVLDGTKTTPAVSFDYNSGILSISGESYPENSSAFYETVLNWLDKFIATKRKIEFNFKFVYFNTSSSKAILDIIEKLDEYFINGGDVRLNWLFETDDEDIYDSGLEFTENIKLPTQLIEYKD